MPNSSFEISERCLLLWLFLRNLNTGLAYYKTKCNLHIQWEPTTCDAPSPFPFWTSWERLSICAMIGYPCADPKEDNFVLSAYRVMHRGFPSSGSSVLSIAMNINQCKKVNITKFAHLHIPHTCCWPWLMDEGNPGSAIKFLKPHHISFTEFCKIRIINNVSCPRW